MSIEDYIEDKVKRGKLFYAHPTPGSRMMRRIILPPKLYREVYGGSANWKDPAWRTRAHGLQCELAHVVDGYTIEVALSDPHDPFGSKPRAILRQLHEGAEEVWELRATYDPPLRLFGRVAARDWFVALDMDKREDLPTGPWEAEKARCKSKWNRNLPKFKPVSGTIDAYFSSAFPV